MSKDKTRISGREALMDIEGWKLVAYSRTDGKEMWSIPLTAEPLQNGLAIAADGSVLVTLRDGTVLAVGK